MIVKFPSNLKGPALKVELTIFQINYLQSEK